VVVAKPWINAVYDAKIEDFRLVHWFQRAGLLSQPEQPRPPRQPSQPGAAQAAPPRPGGGQPGSLMQARRLGRATGPARRAAFAPNPAAKDTLTAAYRPWRTQPPALAL
jgi:hypothetical protein